uniref:Uncharacterized protein n=1 Tax=Setaria viridis TaxID=4556 RepID=A0A4U6TMV7_SETVI|nr:hypothetical protein SEVIR_7G075300v2 [Setaria viridis]
MLYIDAMPFRGTVCHVLQSPPFSQLSIARSSPWSWSGSSGARSTTTSNSHHVESAHVGKIFPFLSSLLM